MRYNKGFTFVEVLLALVILATSMALLTNLQVRSVFRVAWSRQEIDRIFLIKQNLYKLFLNPSLVNKLAKQRLQDPEMMLICQANDLSEKSSLKAFKERVQIISCQGTWKRELRDRTIKMVTFVLKPSKESHEK